MSLILILNCGSSSLKYEVFAMPENSSLGKGLVERIGENMGKLQQQSEKGDIVVEKEIANHQTAVDMVLAALVDSGKGLIDSIDQISGVGHRFVHGGEKYADSVIIDPAVVTATEENIELAPLHNPANITGYKVMHKALPDLPQVAVFDTAFHQTLPSHAYLYGLPRELYNKYKIRRYGFHGTSHRYVSRKGAEALGKPYEQLKIITCHLGNGASLAAIDGGKSVDTSMGLTPLEGLLMGTRCGDLDPAILLFLLDKGYQSSEINKMLNKQGGLLGVSEISNDMRDVEKAAAENNTNAQDALDIFAYRIKKYIGAYIAALNGVDLLIFTGGIGENGIEMRRSICQNMEGLGITIDPQANNARGKQLTISKTDSPVTVMVTPTNEELQIALDTYQLI